MQTDFAPHLLADPETARCEKILRTCVHCGFCTATCPTYLINGDELDSPRGRIYLIKDMLENDRPADARTVRHVDRCLSCLACMTTCPSGVHFMHLVDHARAHIEKTFRRPPAERLLRAFLAEVLPRPALFRLALRAANLARPLASLLPARLRAALDLAPRRLPPASPLDRPQVIPAQGERKKRAVLLTGCAQTVLDPRINEATIRFLTRHGVETVVAEGAGCCGALVHHLGKSDAARRLARANLRAWTGEMDLGEVDYIVANASGCGTMLKDYAYLFCDDPANAEAARRVSQRAKDVIEVAAELVLKTTGAAPRLRVAYHSACSMQHGQKITTLPFDVLERAGFEPISVPEGHICCGSAGTYNMLQPEFAVALRTRKIEALRTTECDLVAAGNIGCMMQIMSAPDAPRVVHTIELLDWATGGPAPEGLGAAAPH